MGDHDKVRTEAIRRALDELLSRMAKAVVTDLRKKLPANSQHPSAASRPKRS